MVDYSPPSQPPPLLTGEQVGRLIEQGHLELALPSHLQNCISALASSGTTFFKQSRRTKAALYPSSHGTESGYYNVDGEKEFLTLRCAPSNPPSDLERQAKIVWSLAATYLYRILCDVSAALDISNDVWSPLLDGCRSMPEGSNLDTTIPTVLRIFHYEPDQGTAAPHTDIGLLTLCTGDGPSLQVWNRGGGSEGEWVDVATPTLLVGDTLRLLSSTRCVSGLHRVVGNPWGRESIVFALRPSLRHEIDLGLLGGSGSVGSAELYTTIRDRKSNVNARRDGSASVKGSDRVEL
ncbi:hypothetical protein LTR66_006980 [Elasticomyces elasticus]|nr:hypothetical protein LTR66_006980 [Elasticomyces elasticus]